jgi:hypothetical protein
MNTNWFYNIASTVFVFWAKKSSTPGRYETKKDTKKELNNQ